MQTSSLITYPMATHLYNSVHKCPHIKQEYTQSCRWVPPSKRKEFITQQASLSSSVICGLTSKLLFLEILIWVVPYHIASSKNSVFRVWRTQRSVFAAFSLEQRIKGRSHDFFWKGKYSQGTVCISNVLWQILASHVIAFSFHYEVKQCFTQAANTLQE